MFIVTEYAALNMFDCANHTLISDVGQDNYLMSYLPVFIFDCFNVKPHPSYSRRGDGQLTWPRRLPLFILDILWHTVKS